MFVKYSFAILIFFPENLPLNVVFNQLTISSKFLCNVSYLSMLVEEKKANLLSEQMKVRFISVISHSSG